MKYRFLSRLALPASAAVTFSILSIRAAVLGEKLSFTPWAIVIFIVLYVVFIALIVRMRIKEEKYVENTFVCTYCGCEFTPKATSLALSTPFSEDVYLKCPECGCRRPCRIKRE